ncbi:MAG: response regulator [Clostridiales bacterium]|nr:response regulator [Clostridiales bacterium]
MLIPSRIYVASPEALFFETILLQEPEFCLSGSADSGYIALGEILTLSPDILLLDSALPGMDGLAMLSALKERMAAPPRVLFLERMKDRAWAQAALQKGADSVLFWPDEHALFLPRILSCAHLPLPALAACTEESRTWIAEAMLKQLRAPEKLKGFEYMCAGIAALICAPQLAHALGTRLYPYLATQFSTTPQAVERACRTAIEHTWLHGDLAAIQALFGFSVDSERGKPTNAEFFSMLAEHGRREIEKARRM